MTATAQHAFQGPGNWRDMKEGDIAWSGAFSNFERTEPVKLVRHIRDNTKHTGFVTARIWEVVRATDAEVAAWLESN